MTSPRDPTAVLGRRVVAYIVDFVIAAAVFFALFAATATSYDKENTLFEGSNICDLIERVEDASICFESGDSAFVLTGSEAVVAGVVPLLVAFANWVLLQGATGASLGKHLTRLRVVKRDGAKAGFGRNIVRWVLLIVDGICGVLGLIVAAATTPHRRVGDFAAGTFVVGRDAAGQPVTSPDQGMAQQYTSYPPAPGDATDAMAPPAYAAPPYTPASQPYAPPTPLPSFEPPSTPAEPAAAPPPVSDPSAPVWDEERNAWLSYDANRGAWLRYDEDAQEWRPL
jgi:uncharacterized RDD family membrane protein YckC